MWNYLDDALSPEQSDVGSRESYYESSEEEDLPEAIRKAKAREKRFQVSKYFLPSRLISNSSKSGKYNSKLKW